MIYNLFSRLLWLFLKVKNDIFWNSPTWQGHRRQEQGLFNELFLVDLGSSPVNCMKNEEDQVEILGPFSVEERVGRRGMIKEQWT